MVSNSDSGDTNHSIDGQDSWKRKGIFPTLAIVLFGPTIQQERVGAFPWVQRILFGWSQPPQTHSNSTPGQEVVVGQTDPLLLRFIRLGLFMLAVIGLYGLSLGTSGSSFDWSRATQFVVWGLIGAIAAGLCGLALGMLFGLPTTRGWTPRRFVQVSPGGSTGNPSSEQKGTEETNQQELTNPPQANAGGTSPFQNDHSLADHDIPYDESTSLEQIADWLTKIIVGLTLVQFSTWRDYFESTARLLSSLMYKSDVPTVQNIVTKQELQKVISSLPEANRLNIDFEKIGVVSEGVNPLAGGLVIASFSLLGFLMAYMWMRRYFIPEMVIARRNAVSLASLKSQTAMFEVQRKLEDQQRKAEEDRLRAAADKSIAEAAQVRAEEERQIAEAKRLISEAQIKLETELANSPVSQTREQTPAPPVDIASILQKTVAGGLPDSRVVKEAIKKIINTAGSVADDPWKGRFGSQSTTEDFTLDGIVTAIEGNLDWFSVELKVSATTSEAKARVGGQASAIYFLHPSFSPVTQRVAFGPDGIAPLRLVAFGAFTVGILLDDGTRLELNLASLPTAQQFAKFLAT